ncbi:hypothetical protein, partial [Glutamicibacter protophormiae]|uniref:hypothetical protein n=1 Tax=Glutamicibacter protophormiae TaxID=37930 RepID=UPI0033191F38
FEEGCVGTSILREGLDFFVLWRHARDPGCWVQLVTPLFLKSPKTPQTNRDVRVGNTSRIRAS